MAAELAARVAAFHRGNNHSDSTALELWLDARLSQNSQCNLTLEICPYNRHLTELYLPSIWEAEAPCWQRAPLATEADLDNPANSYGDSGLRNISKYRDRLHQGYAEEFQRLDSKSQLELLDAISINAGTFAEAYDIDVMTACVPLARVPSPQMREAPRQPWIYSNHSSTSTLSESTPYHLYLTRNLSTPLSRSEGSLADVQEREFDGSGVLNHIGKKSLCQSSLSLSAISENESLIESQPGKIIHRQRQMDRRKTSKNKLTRHSIVEKRYRNKINDELGRLRKKVPSLRSIPKMSAEYAYREGKEKLDRPQTSLKFDKATIVSKASEYITYLEKCNTRLSKEYMVLTDRVNAIQKMAAQNSG